MKIHTNSHDINTVTRWPKCGLIAKMHYEWSQSKIDRIVIQSRILSWLFLIRIITLCAYMRVCVHVHVHVCVYMCLSVWLTACQLLLCLTPSRFIFYFFLFWPKGKKWLRWFFVFQWNYTISFYAGNSFLHSICVCRILHIFVQRLAHFGLYRCVLPSFATCWGISFVSLQISSNINSLGNYFQIISFTVALDFFSLVSLKFSRSMLVSYFFFR